MYTHKFVNKHVSIWYISISLRYMSVCRYITTVSVFINTKDNITTDCRLVHNYRVFSQMLNYKCTVCLFSTLRWRHNEHDGVSNPQPCRCLLSRLARRRSKNISKLRVTGLCAGNSPGTGEFPAQMASNAENVPIWWRHHENFYLLY